MSDDWRTKRIAKLVSASDPRGLGSPTVSDHRTYELPEGVGFEKIEQLLRELGAVETDNPSLAKWAR